MSGSSIPGSAFDADLGSGYDLILITNFLHHFDPATNETLLRRLRDAMAADLCLQAPGDSTLSVSYAEVDGYIDDANVDVVWYIDDVPVMAARPAKLSLAGPDGVRARFSVVLPTAPLYPSMAIW